MIAAIFADEGSSSSSCQQVEISQAVQDCVEELIVAIENSVKSTPKKLTRKPQGNEQSWGRNKRKKAHQSGKHT